MKRGRFTEVQIIRILKEHQAGMTTIRTGPTRALPGEHHTSVPPSVIP
jgi:hypothetical protein